MNSDKLIKTGTTILGMVCKEGVVIATETRATMGTLIAHKGTKKLYRIDDNLALATAGLVGDLQVLARYLTAEANLYRLKRDARMPVKSAATLMSNIMNQRKFAPYYVQLILGGYDNTGGYVFSLDAAVQFRAATPDRHPLRSIWNLWHDYRICPAWTTLKFCRNAGDDRHGGRCGE